MNLDAQTFFVIPSTQRTYTAAHSNALFDGELFLGVQKPISATTSGQVGFKWGGSAF